MNKPVHAFGKSRGAGRCHISLFGASLVVKASTLFVALHYFVFPDINLLASEWNVQLIGFENHQVIRILLNG